MKKIVTCIFVLSFALFDCYSQSIITTFTEDVVMDDGYSFSIGDTVTVFGYGKNKYHYYFAITNNNYVNRFFHSTIPFNLPERNLKKLPDASHVSIFDLINNRKDEIKNSIRDSALKGNIKTIILGKFGGNLGDYFSYGDSVSIVGYNKSSDRYNFAILSENLSGFFWSKTYPLSIPEGIINNLPTTTDEDVINIIEQNDRRIKKDIKEKALKGEIIAVLGEHNHLSSAFKKGDTVSVFGYKDNGFVDDYMLASRTHAEIMNLTRERIKIDEKILANMPSIDDDEVISAYNNRIKEINNMIDEIKNNITKINNEIQEMTDSINNQLISKGYYLSINDVSFTKNSVGQISPNFSFHNNSKKTIKYLDFSVYFKNAVDDVVYNDIDRRQRNLLLQVTGPVEYNNDCGGEWNNTSFYAPTAVKMFFNSMKITYMDGSVVNMNPNKLNEQIK